MGDCSFAVASSPKLWNTLPTIMCTIINVALFKVNLTRFRLEAVNIDPYTMNLNKLFINLHLFRFKPEQTVKDKGAGKLFDDKQKKKCKA